MPDLASLIARDLPPGCALTPVSDGWELGSPGGFRTVVGDLAGQLADVRIHVVEAVLGATWPECPRHGRHPLDPADGWRCPRTGEVWPYGSLADAPAPPVVEVADDEVRWYLADEGWGLIAHRDGDLFVHFGEIVGTGYRELREGQRVSYRLDGRQALLRRAADVRVVGPPGVVNR